ncbi:hypothetical protein ACIQBJ_29270 [Kitasatospora sp. NPDC088391]|uniref:hypothetical protein n=1 Tax=Kitasatospora sp. NPDC088391 TaxID=3364074 RepID=UPI003802E51D
MNTTIARLEALVARVHRHEREWEASFETIPTYDANPAAEQPADDKYMGDVDEMGTARAHDSRDLLLTLTTELEALVAALEYTPGDRPLISAKDFALLSHWVFGDRIGANIADPDGTATARLAEAGYLTPGTVPGAWRLSKAGHTARADYTRAHPVGRVVGRIPLG